MRSERDELEELYRHNNLDLQHEPQSTSAQVVLQMQHASEMTGLQQVRYYPFMGPEPMRWNRRNSAIGPGLVSHTHERNLRRLSDDRASGCPIWPSQLRGLRPNVSAGRQKPSGSCSVAEGRSIDTKEQQIAIG